MRNPIGITGLGIVSSIGENVTEFESSLLSGRSGICESPENIKSETSVKIGAFIKNFSFNDAINRFSGYNDSLLQRAAKSTRRSPFFVQASVLAALEAWGNAGLNQKNMDPYRIGIIVAGSNLTQRLQYEQTLKSAKYPQLTLPSYATQHMDTNLLSILSEVFQVYGEGFTVGGASASGNVAIIKALQLIQMNELDTCIVVGSLADLSPIELQSFYNVGALGGRIYADRPRRACRPFDKNHEGFIFGQASGCLIVESVNNVKVRGINPMATILSGSILLDGNSLANPTEEGETKVMELALKKAGLTCRDVDYINAHGTSSPLGDQTELSAIKAVFKENIKKIWINSTKPLTGHCLQAAGVIEAISTVIQLNKNFLHANINLDQPMDQGFKFVGKKSCKAQLDVAMSNSFGFGGINTSILIKKGES
ncbi:beta-ketoacyl synthase N-terminal-like domain-containing protein [Fictibacillus phosphorivorans]|uniref:beta-ketoacyl synthase N-terminal-like domain-containing protein n=1 Tax=Fictibacillus phosphorivorans TaxID=1221500 RepID=UPI003CF48C1A